MSLGLAVYFVRASHRHANPSMPAQVSAEDAGSDGSAVVTSDPLPGGAAEAPSFLMDSKYASNPLPLPFLLNPSDEPETPTVPAAFLMSSKSWVVTPISRDQVSNYPFLSSSKSAGTPSAGFFFD